MAKASDNEFPSVLFAEGTTPATPGAGLQRLFFDSADGLLKTVDDAGTVTVVGVSDAADISFTPTGTIAATDVQAAIAEVASEAGGGGGGGSVGWAHTKRTAGDLTTTSTSFTDLSTGMDLTLPAAAGDMLEVGMVAVVSHNASLGITYLDAQTRVSGAGANHVSGGAADGAWRIQHSSTAYPMNGAPPIPYTLQAGDIDGGNVTVRLRWRSTAAGTITLSANAGIPFWWYIKVYPQ